MSENNHHERKTLVGRSRRARTIRASQRESEETQTWNEWTQQDADSEELSELLRPYDDAQLPDPIFLDRLERTLLNTSPQIAMSPTTTPSFTTHHAVADRRRSWLPTRWTTSTPRQRALPHIATAFLLLMTFGSIYLAFQPWQRQNSTPGGTTPTVAPTSIPGLDIDQSGVATFPIDLPSDTEQMWWVRMGAVLLAPGEGGYLPSYAPATGVGVELVLDGSFVVSSGAPLQVVRADGTTVEIPADTEVTLGVGDRVFYSNIAAALNWRNPGASQTVLIGVGYYKSDDSLRVENGELVTAGGITCPFMTDLEGSTLSEVINPVGVVTVTFRRLTLEPGTALPPSPEITPPQRWVVSGEIGWTSVGNGIATRPANKPLSRFFAGDRLPSITPDSGVEIVLSNPSRSNSAVFWEIAFTPFTPAPTETTATPDSP